MTPGTPGRDSYRNVMVTERGQGMMMVMMVHDKYWGRDWRGLHVMRHQVWCSRRRHWKGRSHVSTGSGINMRRIKIR